MILGADVSEYQGRPDYARFRACGASFAIARTAFGLGYLDKSYPYNRDAIPAAGLVPGAYHFLRSKPDGTDTARRQADLFLRLAPADAIHALDVEYIHDVRAYGHPLDVAAWVGEYRAHYPTHPLVIYTGRDLWAETVAGAAAGRGPSFGVLWGAGAVPNGYVPGTGTLQHLAGLLGSQRSGLPWGGWRSPALVQFSESVTSPGVTGLHDGDVFFGSDADLHALTGSTTPPLPPTGGTVYGPVRSGDTDAATHGSVSVVQTAAGHGTIVDGLFGANTVIGVENFQARHSLTADGIVGPATAAAMSVRYIPR